MADYNQKPASNQNQGQNQYQHDKAGLHDQKSRLDEAGHSRGGLPDQMRDETGQPMPGQSQKQNQGQSDKLNKQT